MNVVSKHIDTILHNAKNLAKEKGHLKTEKYLSDLIGKGTESFYFFAEGLYDGSIYTTTIKLLGEGTVTIHCEDVVETRELSTTDYTEISIKFENKKIRQYFICDISSIIELDISNNEVYECAFDAQNKINKLVIHNNNIEELDCRHFKELQFLHMFNNPMCSDLDKMKALISGLPDRNEKSFGSIIMYDWVNLGLCGHFDSENNTFCYDKELQYTIKKYENEIYRDIDSTEHSWYQYVDGELKELSEYNRLLMIRRQLEGLDPDTWEYTNENGSIFKNWVFGSAIQYNEEAWKYCDFPFKNAHIADVWETAEKGEGVGITSPDGTKFLHPTMNTNRLYAYSHVGFPEDSNSKYAGIALVNRYESDESVPVTIKHLFPWIEKGCYKVFSNITSENVSSHGDNCYSFMGDRGITSICKSVYGAAPESRYYLLSLTGNVDSSISYLSSTYNDYVRMICKSTDFDYTKIPDNLNTKAATSNYTKFDLLNVGLNDINIITRSLGSFGDISYSDNDKFLNGICSEMFKRIFAFNSQGNSGDGLPWTPDQGTGISNKAQIDNYLLGSECCFVTSINNSKQLSVYSSNDRSDKPYTYSYSCYGEGVRLLSPIDTNIVTGSGTSYATPLHAAETALLLVIFSKLNNSYKFDIDKNCWHIQNSVDNKSNFKNYLDCHLDKLSHESKCAVGNGTIDMLCYNDEPELDIDFTQTVCKCHPIDTYSITKLNQVTEYANESVLNHGHYAKSNINDVVFTDRQHTSFMPLNEGTHEMTVYNDDLNIVEDSNAIYGITDDRSEYKWFSNCTINSVTSNVTIEPVNNNLIGETTSLNIEEYLKECSNINGWTISSVLKYIRNTTDGCKTYLYEDLDFRVLLTVNLTKNREKVLLSFADKNGLIGELDKTYTYVALDCFENEKSTYRNVGYLGMLNGKKFVFTIVKRENCNIFDFYINGQYITTHRSGRAANGENVGELKILPETVGTSHIQFIASSVHNKPLTDYEVAKHSAYLHKEYIKENTIT